MSKLKLIIADDHKIFTNSLKLLLESNEGIEVVREVFDGHELIKTIEEIQVDIVLIDINMPLLNGIEVLSYFKDKEIKSPKFIVISMFTDKAIQQKVQLLGAMAFLPKNLGKEELMDTIFEVHHSKKSIIAAMIGKAQIQANPFYLLTRKEKEILNEISNGLSNQAIADKLFCSLFTIQTHRRNIHTKLGIKGHSALLNYIHHNKHLL